MIVKEDALPYGAGKDKTGVEKDRERKDGRDSSAELNFRSQEPMSAEQLRNLQLQQQLTLQQFYQPLMQGGMPLEMLKATIAAHQAELFQHMHPEQMHLMQLHRQMMLEQEKQVSSHCWMPDSALVKVINVGLGCTVCGMRWLHCTLLWWGGGGRGLFDSLNLIAMLVGVSLLAGLTFFIVNSLGVSLFAQYN